MLQFQKGDKKFINVGANTRNQLKEKFVKSKATQQPNGTQFKGPYNNKNFKGPYNNLRVTPHVGFRRNFIKKSNKKKEKWLLFQRDKLKLIFKERMSKSKTPRKKKYKMVDAKAVFFF